MIEKLRLHLSRLFAVLLVLLMCVSKSMWEDKAPLVATTLFLLGAVLVGIASLGRLWCSLYIAGYKTDHLVTQGPYSISRNPLYFFSFVGLLGVGLSSETILMPLIILIAFIAYYPFVVRSEEAELMRLHKTQFEIYMKEVPRFFPEISLLKEPEEYVVKPVVFRKHIFDALWFIWIMGILETIEGLQEAGIFPTIFKIY